jgi:hypothetical protein
MRVGRVYEVGGVTEHRLQGRYSSQCCRARRGLKIADDLRAFMLRYERSDEVERDRAYRLFGELIDLFDEWYCDIESLAQGDGSEGDYGARDHYR